jgi:hypothetical protein
MSTLARGEIARTIAMAGCARAGSARAGYVPKETTNSAGTATSGPFATYSSVYPNAVIYTEVKR